MVSNDNYQVSTAEIIFACPRSLSLIFSFAWLALLARTVVVITEELVPRVNVTRKFLSLIPVSPNDVKMPFHARFVSFWYRESNPYVPKR